MNASRYSVITSTLALVVALTGTGAWAIEQIGSHEIKPGAVKTKQLHRSAVTGSRLAKHAVHAEAIATGAVKGPNLAPSSVGSSAIADGAVTAADVTLPAPQLFTFDTETTASPGASFAKLADIGTYPKADATSALQISWTGSAAAGFSPCVFQLRVDGLPAGQVGAEVYVPNSATQSVADTALFTGLPAGAHTIEVWARSTIDASYPCTIDPAAAAIGQSFVVQELVV